MAEGLAKRDAAHRSNLAASRLRGSRNGTAKQRGAAGAGGKGHLDSAAEAATPEVLEIASAIQAWKAKTGKAFPKISELVWIFASCGWRKEL